MSRVRVTLLAGVSAVAIVAAQPEFAFAADLPSRPAIATKVQPTFHDRWTWWVEGGAARIEGDPGVAGLMNFDVDPQRWGWEGAIGVEYRPGASPWIWSAQFRYGANGSASANSNPFAVYTHPVPVPFTPSAPTVGINSASRKEHHWVADFMVGRDLGIGQPGNNTVRFGVRIAELHGKTNGTAHWGPFPVISSCSTAPATYCASETRIYEQKNNFLGVGPRIALDGQLPLGNGWAFEYAAGVAGLYGRRKVEQNVNINLRPPTIATPDPVCTTGCPINASSSSYSFVFNVDAMLGISFAINQYVSLMVNYRFDGYWNALRGYDSNGNVTNLDRFYHGPMLRLTVTNLPG